MYGAPCADVNPEYLLTGIAICRICFVSLSVIYSRLFSGLDGGPIVTWAREATGSHLPILRLEGTAGSLPAFVLNYVFEECRRPILAVTADADAAQYLHTDLASLAADASQPLLFPPGGARRSTQDSLADTVPIVQRSDVLAQLVTGFCGIIVTSARALGQSVPLPDAAVEEIVVLKPGQQISPQNLVLRLLEREFERVDYVETVGEVAWRGGIVDIYGYTRAYPVRLEFLGDDIEAIREFDPRTQRSLRQLEDVRIVPNLQRVGNEQDCGPTSLLQYVATETLLATFDSMAFRGGTGDVQEEAEQHAQTFSSHAALHAQLGRFAQISFGTFAQREAAVVHDIGASPPPRFVGGLDRLRRQIGENSVRGADTYILCETRHQRDRLRALLSRELDECRLSIVVESLHQGFESAQLAVYVDHEIFGRRFRPPRRKPARVGGLRQHEVRRLHPGDFVVHTDFGIGKFAGFHRITVRGKKQEALKILYAGEDVLYVNVNAVHKLHKYAGKEGHQPRLTTLGTGQWERTKTRTKSRIKDIARDLIRLYSKRKSTRGYPFGTDTVWQCELEAAFPHEDTPDQARACQDVKQDMEASAPMDRLVCGDVGFGKTEVAIRAAFKAAIESKQVAILVPTTILARQHYDTFCERLAAFPLRIDMLSRFQSKAALRDSIQAIAQGKVDITIGTQRLVSKDVQFKDLGLLIVDEEQRFGVSVKEKLRQLRVGVDTLTLTATPIPRTLQFSLMGARDLSIMATPPPNRQAVVTEIHTYDRNLVRQAILHEVGREGQVFYIHNRVKSIESVASMLRELVPEVHIQVAHGQMKPGDLERIMMGFVDHKFDVLVSTAIIENGLDISNANTIIVDRAQRFGLADLHQLRGRVGRSIRKAYCYLLVPSVQVLTREARRRLQAVEELGELGSGFQLAMRDLDIRGAGNLLGGQQSGFIAELGYETYHSVLDEAVRELKQEEFEKLSVPPRPVAETAVDVDEDTLIPDGFIASQLERLGVYQRISTSASLEGLADVRAEITDRFGPLPSEVENLLYAAELKFYGQHLHLPRVQYRNQRLFLVFPSAESDSVFFDTIRTPLLEKLACLERDFVFRESRRGKLRAIVQDVRSLPAAVTVLRSLQVE